MTQSADRLKREGNESEEYPTTRAILDAIDEHADETGKARAGKVFEAAIGDTVSFAKIAISFDRLARTGEIYRPDSDGLYVKRAKIDAQSSSFAGPGDGVPDDREAADE